MFRVGVTGDFLKPDGSCGFGDIGLEQLTAAGVEWEFFPFARELPPEASDYDGLLVLAPSVTAQTVAGGGNLKVVARFGVGYDSVDVAACTAAGVLVTITPDGVRRPVATAALTLILALAHKLVIKDRLTRTGRWTERLDHTGVGLTGRTLGIIGLGNIGRDLARLTQPLDMRLQAADPWITPDAARNTGVELVPLDDLLQTSDFVCITCALTPETKHLLNADKLRLMKPTAFLVNIARGPIVDQAALTRALQAGQIAGAGLDVFDVEPVPATEALLSLENVIVAPHSLCWTDECFRLIGHSAIRSLLDVAAGRAPQNIVNREALPHPRLAHLVGK
ncbi:MAG: dehydrogenase [Planctomycetaceae bacterium]|nr:dehydrogenase [Planctomycetaceae bacterium]